MKIVLDASAAIQVALASPEPILGPAEIVLAPDLFVAEVTNSAWKYHRFAGLAAEQAELLLRRAMGLVDVFTPSRYLYKEAFSMARLAGHPPYDLFYIALARQQSAALMTRDKKLERLAKELRIKVVP